MEPREDRREPIEELSEWDKIQISEAFQEQIVPKLRFCSARTGTFNCRFAGQQYKNWNLVFKSAGTDFEIVDFEYDPETRPVELPG